jgi:SSS family solute:Na+ symporter
MTPIDWGIVILFNGVIVVYGLFRSRQTQTSSDWFLAGRSLPWWIVGLSLWATAIDSSDLVADSGFTYETGIMYFVGNWLGGVTGWVVAANFIFLPMYRAGMYTNAEYLEARFGVAARVISVFVQVQYRTLILGIIANTMYLVFAIVCGWDDVSSWTCVVAIALLASVYTALGGLKSVAITDAMQTIIMIVGALVFFFLLWDKVGGWSGLETRLDAHQAGLANELLHIGTPTENVPDIAWGCFSFFIIGFMYAIVNHTQSMRLFGSRSEWDLRMAVVPASAILLVTTFINLMVGIMGRGLYPELSALPLDESLQKGDSIYPLLITEVATVGLKGLIVAGVVASIFSTFDSIGSTLSSLLVRDVYARLVKRDGDDQHYLRVGRWLTPVIIFGSFGYVPFMGGGMLLYYLDLVGAFVVPLLTMYLMGSFTRVHRRSGSIGLILGVIYGLGRLVWPDLYPGILADKFAAYFFTILATAGTMVIASLMMGWQPRGELLHEEQSGWLRQSQLEARQLAISEDKSRSEALPLTLGIILIAVAVGLVVLFW